MFHEMNIIKAIGLKLTDDRCSLHVPEGNDEHICLLVTQIWHGHLKPNFSEPANELSLAVSKDYDNTG